MLGGLAMAVLAQRVLRRPLAIPDRPLQVPAVLEVHGELAGDLPGARAIRALEPLTGAQMQAHSARDGDARIQHLLVERVNERIAPGHRPVRPLDVSRRAQELTPPRQRLAAALRLLGVEAVRRGDRRGELHAGDAGHGQDRLLVRRQPLDVPLHHVRERARRVGGHVLHRHGKAPHPADLAHAPLGDEVVDRGHDEQRIAVGVAMEHDGQIRREPVLRKAMREVLAHRRHAQVLQRHLRALPVHLELLLHGMQRMGDGGQLGGTVRAHHEQARGLAPAGQARQEIDGGRVAPVQVFEHDGERLVEAERLEGLHQLAEHAVARRPQCPALDGLEIAVRQERRQLREPGRRVLLEGLDELLAPGRPAQSAERLEHGQVRLAGAVLLDALPSADSQPLAVADLREERLHQCCLPDARLPCHEHQLPLPAARLGQMRMQPGELALPSHQRRRGRRHARGALTGGLGTEERGGPRRRGGRRRANRADEPESAPMDRLDVARSIRGVLQRLAQIADAARQGGVADDGVPPHGGEQVVLGHQAEGTLDEEPENGERLRRQVKTPLSAPRRLVGGLDANDGRVFSSWRTHLSASRAPGARSPAQRDPRRIPVGVRRRCRLAEAAMSRREAEVGNPARTRVDRCAYTAPGTGSAHAGNALAAVGRAARPPPTARPLVASTTAMARIGFGDRGPTGCRIRPPGGGSLSPRGRPFNAPARGPQGRARLRAHQRIEITHSSTRCRPIPATRREAIM